jgi:2-desacetyl-2-hydroxyethyl bacteriochlorophyllide A dehydrogenase
MKNLLKAIVFTKPGEISIQELELGECRPTDIMVKTHYTMVSSGTELRVLAGHYGAEKKFPLIPGYSVVGEVTSLGKEAKGFRVGDLVSCRNPSPLPGIHSHWGGQASLHVYATTGEDRPVLLPAGAKTLDYVIAEIAAVSFRGVEAAAPRPGESAVVIGQGMIGAFSAAWLYARGCRVIVTDIETGRLNRALAWGASAAVHGKDPDAESRLRSFLNGGADIVVESSGTPTGAMLAYQLVRKKPQAYGSEYKVEPIGFYHGDWPRLVMQANYLETVTINPFGFIPGEGVTILAPKDRGVEDRQKVVEAIRRGQISAHHFIGQPVPFAQAAQAYAALRDDKNNNFSLVFDWRQD